MPKVLHWHSTVHRRGAQVKVNRLPTYYPLTIVYLPLKWCEYAFKFFSLDVLREKSYFPVKCVKSPENCLLAQQHAPQTDTGMKDEIWKQLIRVVFATVAIGSGVNIPEVRHVIHLEVPRTLESYHHSGGSRP